MFEGAKAWTAIQSTIGGIGRARRQHGMQEPPSAYNTFFVGQKHTCIHIMKNLKCSGFEAAARLAALLYWSVRRASESTDTPELMRLAQDFKDSVVMALSKDGEAGAGSRNGVWQPTTIADEIIQEMESAYRETAAELTKVMSQAIGGQQEPAIEQSPSPSEANPFPAALKLAAQKFDWDDDSLKNYSDAFSDWTLEEAYKIADDFGLDREDLDHVPWELHPMLQAAISIARQNTVRSMMDEMSERRDESGHELENLNVLTMMMLETSELSVASKYLEIAEATYEVLELEWEDAMRGNAHYFADNLDKLGLTQEYLREKMISLAQSI